MVRTDENQEENDQDRQLSRQTMVRRDNWTDNGQERQLSMVRIEDNGQETIVGTDNHQERQWSGQTTV